MNKEQKNYIMFIDDERMPISEKDVICRDFEETISYIKKNGCPIFISFDHDLGKNRDGTIKKSGYDIAKWLVEKDIENNGNFIPKNFNFSVHSMNPIGKANIQSYLRNYLDFRQKNN